MAQHDTTSPDWTLVVLVKLELSTSTPPTQPSDQNAVVINKVYDISFYSVQYIFIGYVKY